MVMLAHLFYNTPAYGELTSMPDSLFSGKLDAAGNDSPIASIPQFVTSINKLPHSMISLIGDKNMEADDEGSLGVLLRYVRDLPKI